MEPRQEGVYPFGGFRRFGAPSDDRRSFETTARLSPAMLLARAFLQQGDRNADGKLSREEFRLLGAALFSAWDQNKKGELTGDQIRTGLSSMLTPLDRPTEPWGRGPRMNLQGPEGKRNGLASAAGIEFTYVHADLEFEGQRFTNVAVRYKGNGTFMRSRGSLKRSLKVDLNKYVKGQKLAGVSRLNFHNNVADASWMNEVLSHRLFRDADVPAPRTAYARVYLTVPGKYQHEYLGLYSLVEDLDKEFASEIFGTKKGAILKPVTPDLFGDLGDDWKNYNQTYDPKSPLSHSQKERIMSFCKLVSHANDADFAARLPDYLDLDEFARFMAVTVWLSTLDSILAMGQNFYVYLTPKTGQFQFLPWDLDHSFGQFGMRGSQEQRENLAIDHPWQGENRFLERVFGIDAFRKLYLARLTEFSRTIFRPERITRQVDEVAAAIRSAVRQESADKLDRFDRVVAGEAVAPPGFPSRFREPPKPIKSFVLARAQSVTDQLEAISSNGRADAFGLDGWRGSGGQAARISAAFLTALDSNKDGAVTRQEFTKGFTSWFEKWNSDRSDLLSEAQLRAGIERDLLPLSEGGGRFRVGP
jgi:spore coat protein CotH